MKVLNMNRRFLSLLLVLTMAVSLFSGLTISVSAADENTADADPVYQLTVTYASDFYVSSGTDVVEIAEQGAGYVNLKFLQEGTAVIGCTMNADGDPVDYSFEVMNAGSMMIGDTKTISIATPDPDPDGSRIQNLTDNIFVTVDQIAEGETTDVTLTAVQAGASTLCYYRYETAKASYIDGYVFMQIRRYDPTAEMFTVSDTQQVWDGSGHAVAAAVRDEYAEKMGTVTPKYYDADGNAVDWPTDAGTYTVKLSVTQSDWYNAAELSDASWSLTIAKPDPAAQVLSFEAGTVNKTVGDAPFTNTLTGAVTAVTYSSDNEAVAAVDETGLVTINGAGTAVITADAEATDEYLAASASYTLTVDPAAIYHEAAAAKRGQDGNVEYWEKDGVKYSDEACTTELDDVTVHFISNASIHWNWYKETATGNVWSAYYTLSCANCGESLQSEEYPAPVITSRENRIFVTYTAVVTIDGVDYTSVKTEKKNFTITLNGEVREGYSYGQYVTLTGPDANTSYDWTMDGKVVQTGSRTYSFYVTGSTVITTSEATAAKASLSFTATDRVTYDSDRGYTRIVYTLRWTLPDGCTLLDAGLKRAYGDSYDTVLTQEQLTAANRTGVGLQNGINRNSLLWTLPAVGAVSNTVPTAAQPVITNRTNLRTRNGTYTYTLNMSAATSQKSVNALGYITYRDASGEVRTIYSDVITTNGSHTHTWDAGVVTTEATCTSDGVKTYTCSGCGKTRTEVIPAAGHQWDDGVTTREATETENGEMRFRCSVCGATKDEPIVMDKVTYTYAGNSEQMILGATATFTRYSCAGKYYVVLAEADEVKATMDQDGVVTVSGNGSMDCLCSEENSAAPWHAAADQITRVVIEHGITTVCAHAFEGCTRLTSVELPETIFNIGDQAFYGCSSLTSLDLSDVMGTLGMRIINYSGITSLTIPSSVRGLSVDTFEDCRNLISVTIGGGIGTIPDRAFDSCENLKTVTLLEGVKSIDYCAFVDCSSLTNLYLPKSMEEIEDCAFMDCDSIRNVYYAGSREDRKNLAIGNENGTLTTAAWHYDYIP